MPIGPFEDFEACTTHMMQEEDYSEEEANKICGSMEAEENTDEGNPEKLLEAIREANGIITDLGLKLVSAVDIPAQPSEWMMLKSDNKEYDWKSKSPLIERESVNKENEEKRIAYAPALVPNTVDLEKDVVPTHVVIDSAHRFLKDEGGIDEQHNLIEGKGQIVESWTLKEEREFDHVSGESKTYPAGSWMLGIQFEPETWSKIKEGELQGLSIFGKSEKVEKQNEPEMFECECIECGYILKVSEHCKELTCPECGGTMRRSERPGPGEENDKSEMPIKDEEDKKDDTMTEDLEEIKESIQYVVDAVTSNADTISSLKSELKEEDKQENDQEVDEIIEDAIGMIAEALDVPADEVRNALENIGKEDEDEEDDEEKEEPESEEPESKGHTGEGTRQEQKDTEMKNIEETTERKSFQEEVENNLGD